MKGGRLGAAALDVYVYVDRVRTNKKTEASIATHDRGLCLPLRLAISAKPIRSPGFAHHR